MMNLMIAFRNLFRQKRRNILLSIAIGFGTMVLVIATSFTNGMVHTLMNVIVAAMSGHITVSGFERTNHRRQIIRDKMYITELITNNVEGVSEVREGIVAWCFAMGNGKSGSMVLVGIDATYAKNPRNYHDDFSWMKTMEGNVDDFLNEDIENPIIMYNSKAEELGVKVGDIVRVRTQNIHGQMNTARLTVVALMEAENSFIDMTTFAKGSDVRKLMGYAPQETGSLKIMLEDLKNPMDAITKANKLYKHMVPQVALLKSVDKDPVWITTWDITTNEKKLAEELIKENVEIVSGTWDKATNEGYGMVSETMARQKNLRVGSVFRTEYKPKFEDKNLPVKFTVGAIYRAKKELSPQLALMNQADFYKIYVEHLPSRESQPFISRENPFYPLLGHEWDLLDRTSTGQQMQKKYKELRKSKETGTRMDVSTMYESADMILKMGGVLQMISVYLVMLLFLIILIGVVNSLRMTIRERTREIGTTRAIGMQKKDVRRVFVLESAILAFFASIGGTIVAFILMGISRLFTIKDAGMMQIFLFEGKLHYVHSFGSVFFSIVVIILITVVTAFFPAYKASEMHAAQALRHFE